LFPNVNNKFFPRSAHDLLTRVSEFEIIFIEPLGSVTAYHNKRNFQMPEADATPKAGTKTEKVTVQMSDGRSQDFNKKQKLVKTSTIGDDGSVTTVLDFSNGETRTFSVPTSSPIFSRLAAHGAEQKLGDAIAGESDINDAVLAVDDVLGRLNNGEWNVTRQAGSFTGTSILIQALVEASGKSVEDIKGFLGNKSQAEKFALRRSEKLKPIIDRLEADKASRNKTSVDTDAMLADLGVADAAPAKRAKADANA
jgi:hypothetical protein